MIKRRGGPARKRPTTWQPFLRGHFDVSWGMDSLTVPTLSLTRLYVFLVTARGRRQVVHWATAYSPSMDWVVQQLREATPYCGLRGHDTKWRALTSATWGEPETEDSRQLMV